MILRLTGFLALCALALASGYTWRVHHERAGPWVVIHMDELKACVEAMGRE